MALPVSKSFDFHDERGTVRAMNKRALLYAGFLTAAVAVLLATSRLLAPVPTDAHPDTVATTSR